MVRIIKFKGCDLGFLGGGGGSQFRFHCYLLYWGIIIKLANIEHGEMDAENRTSLDKYLQYF